MFFSKRLQWDEKNIFFTIKSRYSKASRYTALRSTDLGDTRFLIGSQNTWDTRFLAKSLEDARFFLRYTVFKQKPWRCTVFSFDVLDSKRVSTQHQHYNQLVSERTICVKTIDRKNSAYWVWASGMIPMKCLNFSLYVQPKCFRKPLWLIHCFFFKIP